MKMFVTVQEYMAVMGFIPNQQQNTGRPFSFRQTVIIVQFSMEIFCCGKSVYDGADNFSDYMELIYAFTAVACITLAFISISFNNDRLFYIIELSEEEGDFSKCENILHFSWISFALFILGSTRGADSKELHEKCNEFIEKLSKVIYPVVIRLGVPGLVLPKTITSYYLYYTTFAGRDAFELPFPT